jgi:hypothetical protein
MRTCTHTDTHTHSHIHTLIHTYTHSQSPITIHIYSHNTHIHKHSYTHTHIHILTLIHTHTLTYTHSCTHTWKHAHTLPCTPTHTQIYETCLFGKQLACANKQPGGDLRPGLLSWVCVRESFLAVNWHLFKLPWLLFHFYDGRQTVTLPQFSAGSYSSCVPFFVPLNIEGFISRIHKAHEFGQNFLYAVKRQGYLSIIEATLISMCITKAFW